MKANRKLKNYLLFPNIQLKFIFFTLVSSLITVLFCLYQVRDSFSYLRQIGERVKMDPNSAYFKLIYIQEQIIYQRVIIALLIGLVLSLIINFIITHRALGPFYRLKIFFKNYTPSDKKPIVFRKEDYFKDLEDDINKALEIINNKSKNE
jgi:hypothetical protein